MLLGVGIAVLHPLADAGASLHALGYASLFGATSLALKATARNLRKGARWVDDARTAFVGKTGTPAPTPPAAPTSSDSTSEELGPEEFRGYINCCGLRARGESGILPPQAR